MQNYGCDSYERRVDGTTTDTWRMATHGRGDVPKSNIQETSEVGVASIVPKIPDTTKIFIR